MSGLLSLLLALEEVLGHGIQRVSPQQGNEVDRFDCTEAYIVIIMGSGKKDGAYAKDF